MKRLIFDKELVGYISGNLSTEETQIIHKKAVLNGDSDLLLHVQIASLAYQEDLANELLGEDEFMHDSKISLDTPWAVAAKNFPLDNKSKG